ncbi:MAG: cation-efflux pump [Candidatus Thermoplasmatota archaeon]
MIKALQQNLIPNYGDPNDPLTRARYGYLEGLVSVAGNTVLFVIKLTLGVLINSIALIADSFHTLSDVGTSFVVIIGFRIAKKPADKQHPFGYGRVEYIATLIIAILLVITGMGFIQQSVERLINTVSITNKELSIITVLVLVISAIVKEWMARFSIAIGERINSDILIADAWHHRSDALAAIGVAVSIMGSSRGYIFLDPIFGIIVSVIIIWVGLTLVKNSSNYLIGRSPDRDVLDSIEAIGGEIPGVKGVHDISLHDYGSNKVVTLHAEVDDTTTLDKAHEIADALEERIKDKTSYSSIIHIEPRETYQDNRWKKQLIENILKKQRSIISFHNIRVIRGQGKDDITMHLVVDRDMPVQRTHELCHRVESLIKRVYADSDVHIHLEPCKEKDCDICREPCDR